MDLYGPERAGGLPPGAIADGDAGRVTAGRTGVGRPVPLGRTRLRILLAWSLLVGLACGGDPDRPNIVIVILDTVRRDATGIPGVVSRWDNLTPHLNGLAETGTTYPNAWATAPWTVPSHASLFTGLLPLTHGCITKRPRLRDEVGPTTAEVLGRAGYQTAAFYSNPWLSDRTTGLLRGFSTREESPIGGLLDLTSAEGDQGGLQSVRNFGRWLTARDRAAPFFVFINLLEPHLPYDPPKRYRDSALPGVPSDRRITIEWAHEYNAGLHPDETVDWDVVRSLYGGDVATADALLGEILDLLEQEDLTTETVLIVTSDHGENIGDHGLMDHQFSVHETVLAVPLVIHAPAAILAPGIRTEPVLLTDLYPTILDIAGIETDTLRAQGVSLLRAVAHRDPDRPLFADYSDPSRVLLEHLQELNPALDPARLRPAWRTVRIGNLRLTAGSDGSMRLHDLAIDPGQRHDLAGQRPEAAEAMARVLTQSQVAGREETGAEFEVDPQTRELLRSLGYIR